MFGRGRVLVLRVSSSVTTSRVVGPLHGGDSPVSSTTLVLRKDHQKRQSVPRLEEGQIGGHWKLEGPSSRRVGEGVDRETETGLPSLPGPGKVKRGHN